MTILADLNTIYSNTGQQKEYHIQPMTDYDTLLYNQDTTQKTIKDYSAFVKSVDRSTPASK